MAGQQCWIAQIVEWLRLRLRAQRVDLSGMIGVCLCCQREHDKENGGFVHPVARLIEPRLWPKLKACLSLVHWSFFNRRGCDCG